MPDTTPLQVIVRPHDWDVLHNAAAVLNSNIGHGIKPRTMTEVASVMAIANDRIRDQNSQLVTLVGERDQALRQVRDLQIEVNRLNGLIGNSVANANAAKVMRDTLARFTQEAQRVLNTTHKPSA